MFSACASIHELIVLIKRVMSHVHNDTRALLHSVVTHMTAVLMQPTRIRQVYHQVGMSISIVEGVTFNLKPFRAKRASGKT